MDQTNKKEQGFTLIETIAVIMLVGIISAVLGLAIVQGVKSYVFGRSNVAISQKAQLALARMEREFRAITYIVNTNSECLQYRRETASTSSLDFRMIRLNNNNVEMYISADPFNDCPNVKEEAGKILIDNVADFAFSYEYENNLQLETLRSITINLTVNRYDSDRTESFELIVNPRNNGRLNAPGTSE